jgi:hypothetical protein
MWCVRACALSEKKVRRGDSLLSAKRAAIALLNAHAATAAAAASMAAASSSSNDDNLSVKSSSSSSSSSNRIADFAAAASAAGLDSAPSELVAASAVHARRGSGKGPMLKDEAKTLRQLGLVDGSLLWLGLGPPCLPHEFLIEFVVYSPAGARRVHVALLFIVVNVAGSRG